ncbi:MAG: hypothetical protein NWE87_04960 [Candidatus Bathyarchaeota archaeon]|nr:hypothetical protein [Candidatus Bathyarchaeota archaeon]
MDFPLHSFFAGFMVDFKRVLVSDNPNITSRELVVFTLDGDFLGIR